MEGAMDAIGDGDRYLNLETFRRDGRGVKTPVWFAEGPPDAAGRRLFVYTTGDAGKTKRVRRDGIARVAPCDMKGTVRGPWSAAVATIGSAEEFALGMRLLDRKYFPWKQILNLSARIFHPGRQRVVLVIRPG